MDFLGSSFWVFLPCSGLLTYFLSSVAATSIGFIYGVFRYSPCEEVLDEQAYYKLSQNDSGNLAKIGLRSFFTVLGLSLLGRYLDQQWNLGIPYLPMVLFIMITLGLHLEHFLLYLVRRATPQMSADDDSALFPKTDGFD